MGQSMGALLKIESDEMVALATRLAELQDMTIEEAVSKALRDTVAREEAIQAKLARVRAITAEIRANMSHPLPSSDHSDLYDENGLPV
jgi:hypothetical protein